MNMYDSVLETCHERFIKKLCSMTFEEFFNQLPVPVDEVMEDENFSLILNSCEFANFFTNKEFLHLPILKHLRTEDEEIFIISKAGIVICEECSLEHDAYNALIIDAKEQKCYLQLFLYDNPYIEVIFDTSYKHVKDVLPLLEEHTSLLDFQIK